MLGAVATYPRPVKSEFGGVLSRSHVARLLSSPQFRSSSPSSQSWSPLHTRDWLIHWPAWWFQQRGLSTDCKKNPKKCCRRNFNYLRYFCLHCNLPELQRNLSPQPASSGHLFCGTHVCVWVASPEHGTPPNWANTSTCRVRTCKKSD